MALRLRERKVPCLLRLTSEIVFKGAGVGVSEAVELVISKLW